jgi:hypothetical protein
MSDRPASTSQELAADLRWAANRLEAELADFPWRGRNTRAHWAVLRLRMYAEQAHPETPAPPRIPERDGAGTGLAGDAPTSG